MPPLAAFVFFALAALALACAAGVALSRNILHSAFMLLGALGGVAGLYLCIGEVRVSNASMRLLFGLPAALLVIGGLACLATATPLGAGGTADRRRHHCAPEVRAGSRAAFRETT